MNRTNSLQARVAIVDDHQIVSAALAELIATDGRFKLVGHARNAAEAKHLLEAATFDVVLLDLELPDSGGLKLLSQLKAGTAACILSMHTEPYFIKEAVAAGALGYVSKQAAPEELLNAIRAVSQGEPYFSSDVRHAAISFAFRSKHQTLSTREQEVLRLASEGFNNAQIALKLGISQRTAEAHRASLLKKLALKTQTDVVRYALRHGIISI